MTAIQAGRECVRLDVRPLLAEGIEPLDTILRAAEGVRVGGTLELTAPFEPVPLYRVLCERGFRHQTEHGGDSEYAVRFVRTGVTPERTIAEIAASGEALRAVLQGAGIDVEHAGAQSLRYAAWTARRPLHELLAGLHEAAGV
jgi:hypothetical protein